MCGFDRFGVADRDAQPERSIIHHVCRPTNLANAKEPIELVSRSGNYLTYFSPAARGGLAEYAREQADAIARCGVHVRFLAPAGIKVVPNVRYQLLARLPRKDLDGWGGSRLWARWATAKQILANFRALSDYIVASNCRHVLFGSYVEYLAPFWVRRLRRLARNGAVFGAVVHDPVRDAVVGPVWWHRWSIAEGYSFVREVFLHETVELDTGRPQPQLHTTVIPHGMYPVTPASKSAEAMRRELDIPMGAKVLLAFGHVRDNKNLDLVLRALRSSPQLFLMVAGKELSAAQRPISFYRRLAEELGVGDRCRWRTDFIPENEVGDFFAATDLVMLTYSSRFRSASGVLNLAVGHRKQCVASSGQSNLQRVVSEYGLGIWIEPDSEEALVAGIRQWIAHPVTPEWDRYKQENSWARNAELVVERMFKKDQ